MGSYGIGPARVMGTIVELLSDEKGMVWPENIAPFKAHLIVLNMDNEDVVKKAEELYQTLTDNEIEVLFDDRQDATAGTKFSDADLIGNPYRIVVSSKTGAQFELKKRTEEESKLVDLEELLNILK